MSREREALKAQMTGACNQVSEFLTFLGGQISQPDGEPLDKALADAMVILPAIRKVLDNFEHAMLSLELGSKLEAMKAGEMEH